MKSRGIKRTTAGLLTAIMLVLCFTPVVNAKKWDVTRGTENYNVDINNSSGSVFIYNKKSVGTEVGTEYYMTYTVDKVSHSEEYRQQGVIGTNVPEQGYPYMSYEDGKGGVYHYDTADKLLIEGNTYFLKFTITEEGFTCRASWAQGERSNYIKFSETYEGVTNNLGHFGVFIADKGATASLIKVRCYDKDGNDLGVVAAANPREAYVGRENGFQKNANVKHSYSISVNEVMNLAISNKWKPTSDKVYMEYTVKATKDAYIYQPGVIISTAPTESYPYLNGYMWYDQYERDISKLNAEPMLTTGADYLVIFERKAEALEVTIQKTVSGKSTFVEFMLTHGTYNPEANFFSLWFCGMEDSPYDLELIDFKCYDSNNRNLGVQCNKPAEITHVGELEDYSGCEAVYYNFENASYYALYEDNSMKYTEEGKTLEGTFSIEESVLTTKLGEEVKTYNFKYQYFSDEEENTYHRLHTYKVTFDTGEGSKVKTQTVGMESGYKALQPTNPELKDNTFEGWYTLEGEEFNFDNMVTESITLYAKWQNTSYTFMGVAGDFLPYIAVGAGALILIAGIAVGIVTIRGGKKHGSNK